MSLAIRTSVPEEQQFLVFDEVYPSFAACLQGVLCSLKLKKKKKVNSHSLVSNFEVSLQKNACGPQDLFL